MNPVYRHVDVGRIEIDQHAIAAEAISDEASRAAAGEWIEDARAARSIWRSIDKAGNSTFAGWLPAESFWRLVIFVIRRAGANTVETVCLKFWQDFSHISAYNIH